MSKIIFQDWKLTDYEKSWKRQKDIFNYLLSLKAAQLPTKNYLIFVEHPHVYTLGKSGDKQNLLISPEMLNKIEATYYHVDRGGDITYHGFGQIVGYPVFDLESLKISYRGYINKLENSIITYLKEMHHIKSFQLENATGVWVKSENGVEKICAIGVRASRFITMHGFALNINTDLHYFNYINPCGFTDKGVTSLEKIKGEKQDFEAEKKWLRKYIVEEFEI